MSSLKPRQAERSSVPRVSSIRPPTRLLADEEHWARTRPDVLLIGAILNSSQLPVPEKSGCQARIVKYTTDTYIFVGLAKRVRHSSSRASAGGMHADDVLRGLWASTGLSNSQYRRRAWRQSCVQWFPRSKFHDGSIGWRIRLEGHRECGIRPGRYTPGAMDAIGCCQHSQSFLGGKESLPVRSDTGNLCLALPYHRP